MYRILDLDNGEVLIGGFNTVLQAEFYISDNKLDKDRYAVDEEK